MTRKCLALLLLALPAAIHARKKEALLEIEHSSSFEILTSFGYDTLLLGQSLGPDEHMVALADKRPRLNPLLLTEPTPGCSESHPCYLKLDETGVLAVYAGTSPAEPNSRLLRHVGGPQGSASAPISPLLALELDGNLVLRAMDSALPRVLWSTGSSLPSACLPEAACAKGAHVAFLQDGSLALFLGLSAAAEAYLEVGLAATQRLEGCLWHNDFTGPAADEPKRVMAAAEADGECYMPPVLQLISFPSSGATFTLEAITAATNQPSFTASLPTCPNRTRPPYWTVCGKNTFDDMGYCPLGYDSEFLVPKGKGAVVKNHVIGDGDDPMCSAFLFAEGLQMGDNGVHFESYGFMRLFRNPFDNMVGRMHHRIDGGVLKEEYSKAGFLSKEALFPHHDIWTMLDWQLNANLALMHFDKPTALFSLDKIDRDQVAYMRRVVEIMGYSEDEITTAFLGSLFSGPLSPEEDVVQNRFRYGPYDLPVHIDFYDAPTVRYVAAAMETVVEGSACLTRPYCMKPAEGFLDFADLKPNGRL